MDQLVAFLDSALPELALIPFFVLITLAYFPNYRGWKPAVRIIVLVAISPFTYMVVVKLVALGLSYLVALAPTDSDVYQVMVGTLTLKLVSYLVPIPLFTHLYAAITKAPLRICQFIYSAFIMMLVDAALIGFDVFSTFLVMFAMGAVWCVVFRASITSLFFKGSSERLRFYNFIAVGLIVFAVLVNLAPQLVSENQIGVFNYMTVDLMVIGVFLYLLTLFIYKNMLSNIEQYRQLEESKVKLQEANRTTIDLQEQMIVTLADVLGDKSGESGTHLKRVAESVRIIAAEMGFPSEKVQTMSFAAMLHDVGKLRIPNEILHKPGKLTDEEFELMKQHTVLGRDLLGTTSGEIMDAAKTIAMEHHERWDGGDTSRGSRRRRLI